MQVLCKSLHMENRIALVTGATSGFGEAIVRRFIHEGIKVVGTGRRKERLDQLKAELGDHFVGIVMDVQDKQSVFDAIQQLPSDMSKIDILVNNAGLALGISPAQQSKLEDWERMVSTNINGVLYCTHALLPGMVERNAGHIINIGSIAAEFPYPGGNVYGGTKAFLRQFSLNLRADLLGTAIRVTDIEPGLCGGTEFSAVRFNHDLQKVKSIYEGTDPILPEDIAETVFWTVNLPGRVNVNTISMMPTCQAFGALPISRRK